MRLGAMTSFGATTPLEWVKINKELGLKAVVFPFDSTAEDTVTDSFFRAAEENDLIIAEVGVWRNTLAADKEERNRMIEYAVNQLALADRVASRCCVNVVGTPHGPRWDGGYAGNYSKETRKEIIAMIRTIIDEVKPKNTKYSVEPMPWMVPNSPDDYVRLLEEVERDEFGVHFDLINMVTSPEKYFFLDDFLDECLDKLGDKILSCHLKDIKLLEPYTLRLAECPCGEGVLNIKRYLNKVSELDEDMPVLIEHLNSDEEYIRSVEYVKSL